MAIGAASLDDLDPDWGRAFMFRRQRLEHALNIDGNHLAIKHVCTHDGGELTGGVVEGHEIECPRHGARFDVRAGEVPCAPAYAPTAKFPVQVADGAVWTRDDRWD